MSDCVSYDRVKKFLDTIRVLSLEEIETNLKEIEKDIYVLFKKIEHLHAMNNRFQSVDLSEDIYGLVRMLNKEKTIKKFPLLSRAAGLF
ncbi:MAG: hypothetical protein AAB019_01415 [Planctomycetota bacterium]